MQHEQLKDCVLLVGHFDFPIFDDDTSGCRVKTEVAALDHLGMKPSITAHQCSDSRQQLLECERLGEVVIGTGFKASDPLFDGVTRSQHQDWRFQASTPHTPSNLESVDSSRKHHIEDNQVNGHHLETGKSLIPGACTVYGIPRLAQPERQRFRQMLVILDDEHPHCLRLSPRSQAQKVSEYTRP